MRTAKKLTLASVVLVLIVGFAAVANSETGKAAPEADAAVVPTEPANRTAADVRGPAMPEADEALMLFGVSAERLGQCRTATRDRSASVDDEDPCTECWLDCFDQFRRCRRNCPWGSWPCLDECVTQEIQCEQSCPCP